jgi:hypothetical protein
MVSKGDGEAFLVACMVAAFLIGIGAFGGWTANSWYHSDKYSVCREYEKFRNKENKE